MAPVIHQLAKFPEEIISKVAVTAQHRFMLDQVLDLFEIKTDYDLNIMEHDQTLYHITTKALTGLGQIFQKEKPDLILVQGDTTTVFAAAVAAFYEKVAVGHVEAGLRTDNKYSPYPEEMNRRLTSVLTDLHFAPTDIAHHNLIKEGISQERIYITGNTVIDALFFISKKEFKFADPVLEKAVNQSGKKIILVETHRRENLGSPLVNICQALVRLSEEFPDLEFIFPVHKNPRVREVVYRILGDKESFVLTEPVDYITLVNLMKKSHLVMTDSGGIQEEGPAMGKPILVLREVTERPEGIKAGTALLAGTEESSVYQNVKNLLTDQEKYLKMSHAVNPYGDGQAARRTVEAILYYFGLREEKPESFTADV